MMPPLGVSFAVQIMPQALAGPRAGQPLALLSASDRSLLSAKKTMFTKNKVPKTLPKCPLANQMRNKKKVCGAHPFVRRQQQSWQFAL